MSLIKRFGNSTTQEKKEAINKQHLARYFHDLEGEPDFPYSLALETYEKLKTSASTNEDFFFYLIEDAIFTSLYATFYEQILVTIRKNPEVSLELINKFAEDASERERIIAEQTLNHLSFVQNKGICSGCSCCENHHDVSSLIEYCAKGDVDFFATLYIGMQTIQFSMEHLIYDVIPSNPVAISHLDHKSILEFRQYIFDYVEERL